MKFSITNIGSIKKLIINKNQSIKLRVVKSPNLTNMSIQFITFIKATKTKSYMHVSPLFNFFVYKMCISMF